MIYLKYLKYLIKHKWFVGTACFKEGLYWRGIKHDWSKFRLSEFAPYAKYFYGVEQSGLVSDAFDLAWLKHQHRNPHHWQHYVLRQDDGQTKLIPMPLKDLKEMCCDWVGAGRAITGNYDSLKPKKYALEWYEKNKEKIMLHPITRAEVERILKGL